MVFPALLTTAGSPTTTILRSDTVEQHNLQADWSTGESIRRGAVIALGSASRASPPVTPRSPRQHHLPRASSPRSIRPAVRQHRARPLCSQPPGWRRAIPLVSAQFTGLRG
ncbi:hypothetical protein AAFF_G00299890 [Aldrovandia affinis]|uniref:Uncharacterized protein n=1 Tax=Aldrovandia affinis TaxID=143900 RepID=A0AAD7R8D6_9TELE|nr:hypothetical protein AAFF_G00299890 [Aldrovandia affinis]